MVHEKFIKVGDKVYGPYYYESYRDKKTGKVKKRYVKNPSEIYSFDKTKSKKRDFLGRVKSNKKWFFVFGFLFLVMAGFFFLNFESGRVVMDVEERYVSGEQLGGSMDLILKQGELLPADSKLVVSYNNENYEFLVSDLVSNESLKEGGYFVEGFNFSGEGEGIGFGLEEVVYPTIEFDLRVFGSGNGSGGFVGGGSSGDLEDGGEESGVGEESLNESLGNESSENETFVEEVGNETGVNGSDVNESEESSNENSEEAVVEEESSGEETEESVEEDSEENLVEEEKSEESLESVEDSESEEGVEENSEESSGEETDESSESEESASITGSVVEEEYYVVRGEVSANESFEYFVDDNYFEFASFSRGSLGDLDYSVEEGLLNVTTNYSVVREKFGEIYSDEESSVAIDLSKLNLSVFNDSSLEISLVYEGEEIDSFSKEIFVDFLRENETLNESVFNETLKENVSEDTRQYKAVIGKPVRWMKRVNLNKSGKREVKLPKEAMNISVKSGQEVEEAEESLREHEEKVEKSDRKSLITGEVVFYREEKGFFTKLFERFGITGRVVSEGDLELEGAILESEREKIVDLDKVDSVKSEEEVIVEYETPAPLANESAFSNGKKEVVIYSEGEYNYTDILAYTTLNNSLKVENVDKIKVYWYEEVEAQENFESDLGEGYVNSSDAEQNSSADAELAIEEEEIINDTGAEVNETVNETFGNGSVEQNSSTEFVENGTLENETENFSVGLISGNVIAEQNGSELSDGGNETFENESGVGGETLENETRYVRREVNFSAYDLDEDGFIDYVEWVVPHLSEQKYEIILIEKAEHLDSEREFVEDVYDSVKALDGNYTDIPSDDYLRVYFEKNLTRDKDITIYARASCEEFILINGIEVPCEVYYKKLELERLRNG